MAAERQKVLTPFLEQADYMKDRITAGIEEHRKAWFSLTVLDSEGKPLSDTEVSVRQKNHEFRFGANMYSMEEMGSEEGNNEYKRRFAQLFNLATLPFYWNDLVPEPGIKRYAKDAPKKYRRPPIDLCLEFCDTYGLEPKAHCLEYDGNAPQWVKDLNDLDAVRRALYDHFAELSARYADRIPSWEVTNENLYPPNYAPIVHNTPHFYQNDTVEWDFITADRLFPKNHLIINESGDNIWSCFNGNRSAYYMLIERALSKGCRIDSIGMQYHMTMPESAEYNAAMKRYSPKRIYDVLDRYADFARPMQITEISIPTYRYTEEDEDIQAEIVKNLYSIWFSHPNMEAIIYWDFVDGHEWSGNKCGFLRNDLTPKKSFLVLDELINRTWHTDTHLTTSETGLASFKGFFGDYDVTVRVGDSEITRPLHLVKSGDRNLTIRL